MITRKEYMDGKASFAEYYGEIAREAHISYANSPLLPRVIDALAKGDAHLNTIPLHRWDAVGVYTMKILAPIFKAHGDGWSLAGSVCVHKQAAIDAAHAEFKRRNTPGRIAQ